jgi:NAD(P)-dependent dehydrogenase (short-subunit alcohol dehydrogenase family)
MKLQGARVVVMGGSTGIGFAAAKLARQEGAEVTIAGRSQEGGVLDVEMTTLDKQSKGRAIHE